MVLKQFFQVFEIICHLDIIAPLSPDEAACLHIFEHLDGLVPEAVDIVEDNHLCVVSYVVRGSHGENLVEGPDATGQCDAGICLGEHHLFAVGEVVARNLYIEVVGALAGLDKNLRDDADGSSTGLMDRTGPPLSCTAWPTQRMRPRS